MVTCLNFGILNSLTKVLEINVCNLLVRLENSSLNSLLSPCWSSGHHFQWLFQKTVEGFYFKING